jgi:hypothetical protein
MAKTGIVTRALWRMESWVANDSNFFLSLDTTPTGAENLQGGLHAVTVTGNAAVVAASALALLQSSNSCGVMKVKEKLGEAI